MSDPPAVIDLFAGPGGWDFAARSLGLDPHGIEWDDAACATREAVGLRTTQADVASLEPTDFAPCELLIASPPCPTFSRAGKGDGIRDLPLVWKAAKQVVDGTFRPGELPWRDVRSELVVEPLRWALVLRPTYLAWEQVPDVLPFWEFCATILREHGWSVWTGVLEAERYGVPQTRERAILMASRAGHVEPPRPTHQRYVKGEPQRREVTLEGEILPWVSMAEALGWAPSRVNTRGDRGDDPQGGNEFDAGQPSWALTEKARSWTRRVYRNGNRANAAERTEDEPAPTLHFGHALNKVEWVQARDSGPAAEREPRASSDPSYTIRSNGSGSNPSGVRFEDGSGEAVRVTLEEAAVLQGFPPDYPFQGTKTKRFEQVGNAVPPLLARAVLKALLP